jgi:hypothetical protein
MRELRHFFDSLNIPLEPRTMACPLNAFVMRTIPLLLLGPLLFL